VKSRFEHSAIDRFLTALGEHLAASGEPPLDLVVCGGTAMNALGYASRPTQDVDVVALLEVGTSALRMSEPLPPHLVTACRQVADDFGVPAGWLNSGPADLLRLGLPAGCAERLVPRAYGTHLTLHYLVREDLIPLKLYAWADTRTARHADDLRLLKPTTDEWREAARWVLTHNEPDGFLPLLAWALRQFGADDVADRLPDLL
jgi:hypothetical protein